jgi:hypothetical protein
MAVGKHRILAIGAGRTINGRPVTMEKQIKVRDDAAKDIDVRWYVDGLIDGLAATYTLGTDYDIWYRHCDHSNIKTASFGPGGGVANNLIFPMSLQVLQAAINLAVNTTTPIVFPSVSDPSFLPNPLPPNVAGIYAQRADTAGACFAAFVQTAGLQTGVIDLLCCKGYPPSDAALVNIQQTKAQQFPNATIKIVNVTQANIAQTLPTLLQNYPCNGLMVLPVDFCFAAAYDIINNAQQVRPGGVPTFFPIPDWVQPKPTTPPQAPALGGYGVKQYTCGYSAAGLIAQIWNQTATATNLGVQKANIAVWSVSKRAAKRLKIKLPSKLQKLGAQFVP